MNAVARCSSILLCTLLCADVGSRAQPAETAPPAGEAVPIQRSLERIGRALEALVALERTNLLFQQVVLEERRLSPLTSDLRSASSSAHGHADEIARIESYRRQIAAQIEEVSDQGLEPESAMKSELVQLEEAIRLERGQQEAAERRVIELENELAKARRNLDNLGHKLDQVLEEPAP